MTRARSDAEQHRHVRALDRGEPLDVRVDQVGEPVEVLRTPFGAERRPRGERLVRRRHRELGLTFAAARDLRERLRVDRREVREGASLATRSPPMKCSVETSTPATSTARSSGRPAEGIAPTSTTVRPPSTGSTAPLTPDASSESSQATIAATSSGVVGPSGRRVDEASAYASSRSVPSPRAELLHLVVHHRRPHPAGAYAVRTHAGRPVIDCDALRQMASPALEAQYASTALARQARHRRDGDDRSPSLDEVGDRRATDEERPEEIDAEHSRKPPGSASTSEPGPPVPAFSTNPSSPPNASIVSLTARSASAATEVSATTASPPISLRRPPRARAGVP